MDPIENIQTQALEAQVVEVIKTVFDPEVPVNIHEMGLIYGVEIEPKGNVHIKMTLTSPACPVAGTLPVEVENKVKAIDGVEEVKVEIVWDPPWTPDLMSEAAKLQLNML